MIAVLGEEGGVTAQQVCEATAMDKVTVSRAVRALADRGLVQRRPHDHDKRATVLSLSSEGQSIYSEIAPIALKVEAELLHALSPSEVRILSDLLERVRQAASRLGD